MHKRAYHHGNLRAALIEAALDLIREKGPAGFTLSHAAKLAGVTPAAVYRHFSGREDLIAAAALQGYEIFNKTMDEASARHVSDMAAFIAAGRAYLDFAQRFPGHYVAMFESGISVNRSPELAAVALGARARIEARAKALTAHIPVSKRPPASMIAAHIWAISHGVVELFARAAPGTQGPFTPEDLLESGVGIYLRGLGLIDPDTGVSPLPFPYTGKSRPNN